MNSETDMDVVHCNMRIVVSTTVAPETSCHSPAQQTQDFSIIEALSLCIAHLDGCERQNMHINVVC